MKLSNDFFKFGMVQWKLESLIAERYFFSKLIDNMFYNSNLQLEKIN